MMTDWHLEGLRHKCICGAIWTDQDGEPCHWECDKCEAIMVTGDECPCTEDLGDD